MASSGQRDQLSENECVQETHQLRQAALPVPPELLRVIVDHALWSPVNGKDMTEGWAAPGDALAISHPRSRLVDREMAARHRSRRATLLSLSLTSRTFHEICSEAVNSRGASISVMDRLQLSAFDQPQLRLLEIFRPKTFVEIPSGAMSWEPLLEFSHFLSRLTSLALDAHTSKHFVALADALPGGREQLQEVRLCPGDQTASVMEAVAYCQNLRVAIISGGSRLTVLSDGFLIFDALKDLRKLEHLELRNIEVTSVSRVRWTAPVKRLRIGNLPALDARAWSALIASFSDTLEWVWTTYWPRFDSLGPDETTFARLAYLRVSESKHATPALYWTWAHYEHLLRFCPALHHLHLPASQLRLVEDLVLLDQFLSDKKLRELTVERTQGMLMSGRLVEMAAVWERKGVHTAVKASVGHLRTTAWS